MTTSKTNFRKAKTTSNMSPITKKDKDTQEFKARGAALAASKKADAVKKFVKIIAKRLGLKK
jgi:hypothetical protein